MNMYVEKVSANYDNVLIVFYTTSQQIWVLKSSTKLKETVSMLWQRHLGLCIDPFVGAAGLDTHNAGAGGSVTDTFREWAVMVKNPLGTGRNRIVKTVPRRALHYGSIMLPKEA